MMDGIDDKAMLAKHNIKVWMKASSPKKVWKSPRPIWYAKVPNQHYALCRSLGGHLQWGQKFMFWEDPTTALVNAIRKLEEQ